jgi:hypothetical protein
MTPEVRAANSTTRDGYVYVRALCLALLTIREVDEAVDPSFDADLVALIARHSTEHQIGLAMAEAFKLLDMTWEDVRGEAIAESVRCFERSGYRTATQGVFDILYARGWEAYV